MASFTWRTCISHSTPSTFLADLATCLRPIPNALPLSNPLLLPLVTLLYLAILHLLHRSPIPPTFPHSPLFTKLSALHNILLSLLSLFMNLSTLFAIHTVTTTQSLSATICTPTSTPSLPPTILFSFYFFYLSKFHELLDTVILVLRRRPLTPLHLWHHASVFYEVYCWLHFRMTIGIYGMWFNTAVHVIMYAYYACALLQIKFPFKRAITVTQIVQFLTGFASLLPFAYLHLNGDGCSGVPALAVSSFFNLTYLILFVRFYKKAYNPAKTNKIH